MTDIVKLPIGEITKDLQMNVKVTGYSGWLIRIKIAMIIFRFGAWVAGVGIKVHD